MTPNRIIASTLAAVVAISGIGSILIASHAPGAVQAVELSSERDGPPTTDFVDPAILRRDDDADDGIEAVDDDRDDPTGDGVTTAGDTASVDGQPSVASAASMSAATANVASAPSAPSAPSKASAPSAPSASAASASAASASADSGD
jgi:hypothetical protein